MPQSRILSVKLIFIVLLNVSSGNCVNISCTQDSLSHELCEEVRHQIIYTGPYGPVGKICYPDWFGDRCQYQCHCENEMQCDNTTGACPGKCASGWFGPACQYVSAKFLASPSDRFKGCNMTYLEDTDDTTCDTTRTVFLKMDEALPVTWLRLIGDDAEQLSQITIAGWSSYNVIKVDGKTVDFFRSPHGISISTNIYFSSVSSFMLCSIYISRGRNVALSRETTQSSSYLSWRAFRGVDSDTNTCTHTHNALKPAYWSLIFLQPTSVFGVRIYNRVDCCSNRLIGFTLRLIDKQHRSVYEYTDTNKTASAVYSLPFKGVPSAPVQFLNISKSLKSKYLTVCEVIVYGDSVCPSGTFGRECERKCNCDHKQEPCFVSTGGCPSGCALGYTGEDCWKALSVSLDKVGFVKKGALSGQSSQTPTYIGVGVALTALAVLTVLVALVLLKRKRRSSTSEGGGGIKFTSMEE